MSKLYETLKNWTRWMLMGVIYSRLSTGACQGFIGLPLFQALPYCMSSPRSQCIGKKKRRINVDSTSMAVSVQEMPGPQREVGRDSVNGVTGTVFQNFFWVQHAVRCRCSTLRLRLQHFSVCLKAGWSRAS